MTKVLNSIEIYPKIVVYKNVFKNIDEILVTLKKSTNNNEDRIFEKWSQWSTFGEYLNPVLSNDKSNIREEDYTENQKKQKNLYEEIIKNFYLVTEDYCNQNKINFFNILNETIVNYEKEEVKKWRSSGPTICKYKIDSKGSGMNYHSDYQMAKKDSPGYQFAITALAYFNDDYEGGELDFCIGKKLIKYKPEKGDYIVFPSGSPHILTEENIPYLHGVMLAKGQHKYLSRMYWQMYQDASASWVENEFKFGKEIWLSMQDKLEQEYNDTHKQRHVIEGGVRIQ